MRTATARPAWLKGPRSQPTLAPTVAPCDHPPPRGAALLAQCCPLGPGGAPSPRGCQGDLLHGLRSSEGPRLPTPLRLAPPEKLNEAEFGRMETLYLHHERAGRLRTDISTHTHTHTHAHAHTVPRVPRAMPRVPRAMPRVPCGLPGCPVVCPREAAAARHPCLLGLAPLALGVAPHSAVPSEVNSTPFLHAQARNRPEGALPLRRCS